jgi:hypothetical protein
LDHVGAPAESYSWFTAVVIGNIYIELFAIDIGEVLGSDPPPLPISKPSTIILLGIGLLGLTDAALMASL